MNDVNKLMAKESLLSDFHKVGNLMTSLEMQGISLTLLHLEDDFYLEALQAPVTTINW